MMNYLLMSWISNVLTSVVPFLGTQLSPSPYSVHRQLAKENMDKKVAGCLKGR